MDDTEAYRSLRSSLSRQPRGILRRESFPNRNPSQTSDVGLSVQFAADDLESTAGSESFLQLGDFDTPRTDESVTDSSTRASALSTWVWLVCNLATYAAHTRISK